MKFQNCIKRLKYISLCCHLHKRSILDVEKSLILNSKINLLKNRHCSKETFIYIQGLTLEYRIVVLDVYSLFQNFLVTLDEVRYFHLLILRVASVWTFIRFYPFIKIFWTITNYSSWLSMWFETLILCQW